MMHANHFICITYLYHTSHKNKTPAINCNRSDVSAFSNHIMYLMNNTLAAATNFHQTTDGRIGNNNTNLLDGNESEVGQRREMAPASSTNNHSSHYGGNNRVEVYQDTTIHGATQSSSGLSKVVKLMKSATHEKKTFAGKRKPLGKSNGNRILESKAASKKELQKIHSKLTEMC